MNAAEMQSIADQLFVGNKLARGSCVAPTDSASTCATSNRRSSCSARGRRHHAPQQALHWILDLYDDEIEIGRVCRRSSIASIRHRPSRHFRVGKIATKEHGEFAQSMDMIDLMPPGLYEA